MCRAPPMSSERAKLSNAVARAMRVLRRTRSGKLTARAVVAEAPRANAKVAAKVPMSPKLCRRFIRLDKLAQGWRREGPARRLGRLRRGLGRALNIRPNRPIP